MNITALVENTSECGLKAVHGLSLFIQTEKHRLLFDLGPDGTLFDNCEKQGIDLASVDTVVISHGHADHGGALARFLNINTTAKIYVQKRAFEKHFSKVLFLKKNIGLDAKLAGHPQIIPVAGDFKIDAELELFTVTGTQRCRSPANDTLLDAAGKDDFSHEQNLLIRVPSSRPVLIVGCGHTGIVNIMVKAAPENPRLCVGGYHLFNPVTRKTVPEPLLDAIAGELAAYDTAFYTCHCTGQAAFRYLAAKIPAMHYLSGGESITA